MAIAALMVPTSRQRTAVKDPRIGAQIAARRKHVLVVNVVVKDIDGRGEKRIFGRCAIYGASLLFSQFVARHQIVPDAICNLVTSLSSAVRGSLSRSM